MTGALRWAARFELSKEVQKGNLCEQDGSEIDLGVLSALSLSSCLPPWIVALVWFVADTVGGYVRDVTC
jgi:hypothetical protein